MCLIARRQQLPSQPCTYFWISDGLALDGVIRSDNRGSESLFPLWRMWSDRPDRMGTGEEVGMQWEANFSSEFLGELEGSVGIPVDPREAFAYIYVLFHSPSYRERYAAELRSDFPRILLPGSKTLYASLTTIGQRLIELHLLRADASGSHHINESERDGFRVGGYTVLKKWLQPRHRSQSDPQYARIVAAIDETINLMARIDATIAEHGGFPAAFACGRLPACRKSVHPGRQDACPTD